jgi:hypothetical protein
MPGVVYRKLCSDRWTSVDIGMKAGQENPAAEAFLRIVRPVLTQSRNGRPPAVD